MNQAKNEIKKIINMMINNKNILNVNEDENNYQLHIEFHKKSKNWYLLNQLLPLSGWDYYTECNASVQTNTGYWTAKEIWINDIQNIPELFYLIDKLAI